jgi:hypothetical protein
VIRRPLAARCRPLLAVISFAAFAAPARGASKFSVAALGDGAPGGGVFAGPSFVGEPSAAGNGWVAFRAQVEGKTTEQIVVRNMISGQSDAAASIGSVISNDIGKFKQFLGKPTVNAHGDVAFAALVTPPEGTKVNLALPPPGGIFLYSQGKITVIATPSVDTGAGVLDLTTPINIGENVDAIDVAERTPALNDNGDVAFVSSVVDPTGNSTALNWAIFLRRAGQALATVYKRNDPYPDVGGKFDLLGPPALNAAGTLAFHALVNVPGKTDPLDGIFKLEGGTLSLLIRDSLAPLNPLIPATFTLDPIAGFDDVVVLNDQGDVACTGGPLFDNSTNASLSDFGSSGVILIPHGGTPVLVGYPGQLIPEGSKSARVSGINLGTDAGSRIAPPSLTPGGQVVFFASVNSGGRQEILRANTPTAPTVDKLLGVGGSSADTTDCDPNCTPVGGSYQSASSAPAVDATGALAFTARIENAPTTSEAFIYFPIPRGSGTPQAIRIGDAAEDMQGTFGGPAFSAPQMNDAGDVIFLSYVARGPSSLGIFRYRQGVTDALVRVGDAAPTPPGLCDSGATFTNLLGDPSINTNGDVAFAATVSCCKDGQCGSKGRGLFVLRGGTLQVIAMPNVDIDLQNPPADKVREGPSFRSLASNPALADSGAVAFRATLQYQSPFDAFSSLKENGIYLIDDAGVHVLAWQGEDSGAGGPFFNFRDPTIRDQSVLFRAVLGDIGTGPTGLFVSDPSGLHSVAIEGADLGGMTLSVLSGRSVSDAAGEIVFPAQVDNGVETVLRRTGSGFEEVVRAGDTGPQGGLIRSIGRPSVSSPGHVAFRLSFLPLTGGVPGLFLASVGPLQPFLRIGEGGGDGVDGRITGINQNLAFNSLDQTAFLATIGGGKARSAILMATAAKLSVGRLAFKRGPGTLFQNTNPKPKDQIQFSAVLKPGKLPRAAAGKKAKLRRVAMTVAVGDMKGNLWTVNVPSNDVRVRGRTFVVKGGTDTKTLRSLRVRIAKDGTVRVAARSAPFDLNFGASAGHNFDSKGAVVLEPPFNVRVDVGGEGGNTLVNCTPKPRRFRCGG